MLPITFIMALAAFKANAQTADFLTLITAATQAPSGHNSQPWWFETSEHSIVIKPNFEKALPAVDSQHRELFISLGCALENLCLKATQLHYQTEVSISEEGIITVGLQQSATVTPNPLAEVIAKRQTNRSLTTLYQSSQILNANTLNDKVLSQVLDHILVSENLKYIKVEVMGAEHWDIAFGTQDLDCSLQTETLSVDNEEFGELSWQAGLPCPDPRMMQNLAQMLGRALYFQKSLRQQEQLLLMEERSIIARELHDSLAQVLSFLQIQLTLLKHNLKKEGDSSKEQSLVIIRDFEQALSSGYAQLRELLATFRLTIQEANLQLALEQVIDSLRSQTTMQMNVNCQLPSQSLNPQQLVHVLQIVREATTNAIKHSQGTAIEISAKINAEGEYEILVEDNGIGIQDLEEPEGHYGLNIMTERSRQLNAEFNIIRREQGGTQVKITLPHALC